MEMVHFGVVTKEAQLLNCNHNHHQSVLPKGRSFTANSGTKYAILPKSRSSTANSGTKVAVSLEMNRCGSFPLLSATIDIVRQLYRPYIMLLFFKQAYNYKIQYVYVAMIALLFPLATMVRHGLYILSQFVTLPHDAPSFPSDVMLRAVLL